jgi:hypothetical protein
MQFYSFNEKFYIISGAVRYGHNRHAHRKNQGCTNRGLNTYRVTAGRPISKKMADGETAFVSEANDSDADSPKLETKRLSHAFSIEKLLSMTSDTTSEMCLRTTYEESLDPTGVGRAGSRQHDAPLGDSGTLQYRRCSYERDPAITSVVSADSSSAGLRPGCCSDCEDDLEGEDEGEDVDDVAAEVSTTLTDGESSDQGAQNGECRALNVNRMLHEITSTHGY